MNGDAAVPLTSGIISRKFDVEKMAVLYGFTLIGHKIRVFTSLYLGGFLVKMNVGYAPLWAVNLILAAIASIASFSICNDKGPVGQPGFGSVK